MTHTLVGIVGRNPASIVVSARTFRPVRAVLFCTGETRTIAANLQQQLKTDPGCDVQVETFPQNPTLPEAHDAMKRVTIQAEDELVFDLTGGTKTMSVGAWTGLAARHGTRMRTVYLEPDGTLRGAESRDAIPSAAVLHPEEFLDWTGAAITKHSWRGTAAQVPAHMRARRELGRAIFAAFMRGEPLQTHHATDSLMLAMTSLPSELPAGFSFEAGRLRGTGDGFLGANGWLEELCLFEALDAIGDDSRVRVALGLCYAGENGGNDESDVVLVRGANVVVIESKARGKESGAGADLHKRVQKAERFFGALTRVIFVHPAWGATPNTDLQESVKASVRLVGSDLAQLRDAVRKGLHLTKP